MGPKIRMRYLFLKRYRQMHMRILQIRRDTKTFSRRCFSQRTLHNQINKLTIVREYRERVWLINRKQLRILNRLNEIISFHSGKYPPHSTKTNQPPTYQIKRCLKNRVRLSDSSKKRFNFQLLWTYMAAIKNNSQINKIKFPNIKSKRWQA